MAGKAFYADSAEIGTRQDFKEPHAALAEVAGAKAQARGWPETFFLGLHPAVGIPVQEIFGDLQWSPLSNRKPTNAAKHTACALVEEQIWFLKFVGELDHVGVAIACLGQNRL